MNKTVAPEHSKLCTAIRDAWTKLSARRKLRAALLREKNSPKNALNAIDLAVSIWRRNVVARTPAVFFETEDEQIIPLAHDWASIVNGAIHVQKVGAAIERAVVDGLFQIGAAKIGLDPNTERPVVLCIDPDDLVIDPLARNEDEILWIGDRFWLPLDDAKKLHPGVEKSALRPSEIQSTAAVTNPEVGGGGGFKEQVIEGVLLMDVFLPHSRTIKRFKCDDDGLPFGNPLTEFDWEYDDSPLGPYRLLRFDRNAGSLYGLAPAQAIQRLHQSLNKVYDKIEKQAWRQKSVAVAEGNLEDADTIREASDGDAVGVKNANAVKEVRFGGPDQQSIGFLGVLQRFLSYFGGNLDALGGLGARTNTVGQEQLLMAAASMRVSEYQAIATEFVAEVLGDFSWWLWTHPVARYAGSRKVEGTNVTIKLSIDAADRTEGTYNAMGLVVSPYSMQSRTPQERLQSLLGFTVNVMLPLLPHFERMGYSLDPIELRDQVAENANMPEIKRVIRKTTPGEMQIAQLGGPTANSGTPSGAANSGRAPPDTSGGSDGIVPGAPGPGPQQGANAGAMSAA